jgi:hypothetical protein
VADLTILYFSAKPNRYVSVLLDGTLSLSVLPAGGNVATPIPPAEPGPAYYSQYTYQWFKDGSPISSVLNNTAITENLVIANVTIEDDSGEYYCEISDGCVATPLAFTPVTKVTVTNNPIVITTQPLGGGRLIGGAAKTFSVVATGGEPGDTLQCQWFYYSDAEGTIQTPLTEMDYMTDNSGTFSSQYTIAAPAVTNQGFYFVAIKDSTEQNVSSDLVQFFVGTQLEVVSTPQGGFFHRGDTHDPALAVTTTGGVGSVTYTWYRDGAALAVSSSTYDLSPLALFDAAVYTVKVSDYGTGDGPYYSLTPTLTYDSSISSPAAVNVMPALELLASGQPQYQSGVVGGTYSFSVVTTGGIDPVTYTWYKKVSNSIGDTEVGTGSTLTIANAKLSDEGLYYCVIADRLAQEKDASKASITSSTARLTLFGVDSESNELRIIKQPGNKEYQLGDTVNLSVLVTGGTSTDYVYTWAKDGEEIVGATQATLTIEDATADVAGTYKVTVYSGTDFVTSTDSLLSLVATVPVVGLLGLAALAALTGIGGAVSIRRKK